MLCVKREIRWGPLSKQDRGIPSLHTAPRLNERLLENTDIYIQHLHSMKLVLSGILARQHAAAAPLSLLQQARPACTRCSASPDHASTSGRSDSDSYAYNSGSSTGRYKATIEHVYKENDNARKGPPSPWNMSWQINERNLIWNDDLKALLLKV